jgi:two-component system, chemotaxis family, response regulator Rcp1
MNGMGIVNGSTSLLLVEDNPIDVRLIRYALQQEQTWKTEITVAEDGEKAINLLLAIAASSPQSARPDFVILDLNLPRRDGTEVLQTIRSMKELQDLPVAIVSSSPMDVIRGKVSTANVSANCYFTKPMDVDSFLALGKELHCCYQKSQLEKPLAASL